MLEKFGFFCRELELSCIQINSFIMWCSSNTDANELYVSGFAENVQELRTVLQKKQYADQHMDERDLVKFAFELKNYHSKEASELATQYNSSLIDGLHNDVANQRLRESGLNIVFPPHHTPVYQIFLLSFVSGFAPLLWIAAALCLVAWTGISWTHEPSTTYFLVLTIVFLADILLSSMYTYMQRRRTAIVLKSFQRLMPSTCMVVRDGAVTILQTQNLVIGDVVVLQTGSVVPADMRVVSSTSMKADKSLLTGEPYPVRVISEALPETVSYLEAKNILFMGYHMVEGNGMGLVIATGRYTQLAKVTGHIDTRGHRRSLLETEVRNLVLIVSGVAVIAVIVMTLYWTLYLREMHTSYMTDSYFLATVVAMVTAIIPVGLQLMLSGGLSSIARRLCSQYFILTKQMHTIETLGTITMLATDKTGTLTQNAMSVVHVFSPATDPSDSSSSSGISESSCRVGNPILQASYRIAAFCNECKLYAEHIVHSLSQVEGEDVIVPPCAKTTDGCLLNWVNSNVDSLQLLGSHEPLASIPFAPHSKIAINVIRNTDTHNVCVVTKGAPEYLIGRCTMHMTESGLCEPMSDEFRTLLLAQIEKQEDMGRRVIMLAQTGPLDQTYFPPDFNFETLPEPNFPVHDLTFVACVSISDNPREGVKEAVQALRTAHIQVVMITGDSLCSAVAIARQVSMISDDRKEVHRVATLHRLLGGAMQTDNTAIVVLGAEVDRLSALEWDYVYRHREIVFARMTPEQKLVIVKQSQARGHIVGVMGDGINDAPSLKRADVGIAMNSGSAVAREVADMVLLRDDFTAVADGVREGRMLFINLRKALAFVLSAGSAVEIYSVIANIYFGVPRPLSVFGMLVITLITDVFGGIALIQEAPEPGLMSVPSRTYSRRHLLDWNIFIYSYLYTGPLFSVGAFYNYFLYMSERGDHQLSNPIPSQPPPGVHYPIGYPSDQLLWAWQWSVEISLHFPLLLLCCRQSSPDITAWTSTRCDSSTG